MEVERIEVRNACSSFEGMGHFFFFSDRDFVGE